MSIGLEEEKQRRGFLKWAGVFGALGLLRSSQPALAADDRQESSRGDIVGTWMVHITFTSPPAWLNAQKRAMSHFIADGQWIGSESVLEPGSHVDGSWKQTTYHGRWRSRRSGDIEVTGNRMFKSPHGDLLLTTLTRIRLRLGSDGNGWQGVFRTQTLDPQGVELLEFTGDLEGLRRG